MAAGRSVNKPQRIGLLTALSLAMRKSSYRCLDRVR